MSQGPAGGLARVVCRAGPGRVTCDLGPDGVVAVRLRVGRAALARSIPGPPGSRLWALAARAAAALEAFLRGGSWDELARLPVAWPAAASPFDLDVWRALRRIPAGATASYGAIARRLKRPGAARAVGGACGRNPLPLIVPCHRVLPAGGGLGGFSAGLAWKEWLLALEGWRDERRR